MACQCPERGLSRLYAVFGIFQLSHYYISAVVNKVCALSTEFPLLTACRRVNTQFLAFDFQVLIPGEPISPQQKGVGSAAVPASCRAVHHEGEKHQKGSDTHPQNQPEPRASREESEQLSLSVLALVNTLLTRTRACTKTLFVF